MAFSPGKDRNMIASLKRVMDFAWFGQNVSGRAQAPDILNGEFLLGVNAAGTGTVNLLGVDANNNVVLGSGDSMSVAVVNLTAANIIAMNATPVSILPAPPTGYALIVDQILFEMTTTSTAFTGGGAVSFVYHGGSVAPHAGSIPASVVTAAAGSSNTLLGGAVATNGTTIPAATGIDITNATAAFAAGTGTAKVKVWYSIVPL
jgi:hypothetical protein